MKVYSDSKNHKFLPNLESQLIPSVSYNSPIQMGPQTNYGNNRWEVYSPKLRRNVFLYSNLEYDNWVLVEADPSIQTFCEQPLKIRIRLPEPIGNVTTIFDIWIKWKSGAEEFREVKYKDELDKSEFGSRVSRQIQAQKKWCELNNKKYSVLTDEIIRSNLIYLSNCKRILRHLSGTRHLNLKPYSESIILILANEGPLPLLAVVNLFPDIDASTIKSAIFDLILSRQITTTLGEKPLNMSAILECSND